MPEFDLLDPEERRPRREEPQQPAPLAPQPQPPAALPIVPPPGSQVTAPQQPLFQAPIPPVGPPRGGRILPEAPTLNVPGGRPAAQIDYGVPDITELRADPYTAQFEQASIARADELASERYNAFRQQRATEMARQGIGPDSPFYQSEMRKVDAAQARESADFRRELEIRRPAERERRTGVARTIEAALDAMERERLADMLALSRGEGFQPSPGLLQALAGTAAQQSAAYQQGISSFGRGVGDLLGAWISRPQQRQTTTPPPVGGAAAQLFNPWPNAGTLNPPPNYGVGEEWLWNG